MYSSFLEIEETSPENQVLNKRLQLHICIQCIIEDSYHKKGPREGKWMINMIPIDPKRPQFLTLIDNRSDLIWDLMRPSQKVVRN